MKAFHLEERKKRVLFAILSVIALFLFWGVLFVVAGKPMLAMVNDPQGFRAWVDSKGIWGRVLFVGFMILQVLVSVIPSEPLEIGAGYAFGAIEGTVLCLLGIGIGSAIIFCFVRRFGRRVVDFFISSERIDALPILNTDRRLKGLTFVLYFIPGIPKDIVTWAVPLTRLSLFDFLWITTLARIFAVVTSTVGGSALGEENYDTAIVVFAVTGAVTGIGYLIYRCLSRRTGKKPPVEGKERMRDEK